MISLGKDLDSNRLNSERSNKRVHVCSLKPENEYKRIKCDQGNSMEVPVNVISGLHEGSQLLQRLVASSDAPKSWQNQLETRVQNSKEVSSVCGVGDVGGGIRCDDIDYGGEDDGGGGGSDCVRFGKRTGSKTTSSQQSNSVLMNLLVSGCDVSAGYVCLAKPKPSKGISSK